MANRPIEKWAHRVGYTVQQTGRVAWHAGHRALMRRIVNRMEARQPEDRQFRIEKPKGPVPETARLLNDIAKLMARDLASAESGYYPVPADLEGSVPDLLARSRAFLKDVPEVARRRRAKFLGEKSARPVAAGKRPAYYRQAFHHQSGGWETSESAQLYDLQVEALFLGSARAMRRQGLVPIAEFIAGQDQRRLIAADIASGTGEFVRELRCAFPRLPILCVDLSDQYLEFARDSGRIDRRVWPVIANAEYLPLAADSLDLATCIYLFHELPPRVRETVAGEISRAVRPDGLFVLVDSLQPGDEPAYDGLLEIFPQLFHEPFYRSYLKTDLVGLMESVGFSLKGSRTAVFSKILHFQRL